MKQIVNKVGQNLCSAKFWLMVGIVFVLCGCSTVTSWETTDTPTIFQLLFYSKTKLIELGEMFSSCSLCYNFQKLQWFIILLPVVAAYPTVYEFAQEWFGGNYYLTISRQKRRSYAWNKVMVAAITGGLVFVLGILLFTVVVYVKFPSLKEFDVDAQTSQVMSIYGTTVAGRIYSYLKMLGHLGILGGVAALISLVLVIIINDRFLALTIPMMIEYLSTKVLNFYLLYCRDHYANEDPPFYRIIYTLIPCNQIGMDQYFSKEVGCSYWYYLLYIFILASIVVCIMNWIVKRRNI